jgi:hypothetical protein
MFHSTLLHSVMPVVALFSGTEAITLTLCSILIFVGVVCFVGIILAGLYE